MAKSPSRLGILNCTHTGARTTPAGAAGRWATEPVKPGGVDGEALPSQTQSASGGRAPNGSPLRRSTPVRSAYPRAHRAQGLPESPLGAARVFLLSAARTPPTLTLPREGGGQSHMGGFDGANGSLESREPRRCTNRIRCSSRATQWNRKFPYAIALPRKGGGVKDCLRT